MPFYQCVAFDAVRWMPLFEVLQMRLEVLNPAGCCGNYWVNSSRHHDSLIAELSVVMCLSLCQKDIPDGSQTVGPEVSIFNIQVRRCTHFSASKSRGALTAICWIA